MELSLPSGRQGNSQPGQLKDNDEYQSNECLCFICTSCVSLQEVQMRVRERERDLHLCGKWRQMWPFFSLSLFPRGQMQSATGRREREVAVAVVVGGRGEAAREGATL